ncbi:hypothetical protein PMZ80_007306 [Knufia obscura]|uniref:Uncharacterized protein n=2 Tax=Knufia TaxID=430999 RepID=A0AAN8EK72_9EURO|nr:hypothetical protein PMZ80_007306 [Knufia obscura]KAK5953318.1 hypothetical protein OHC33_005886 [Knufia fluminis]
MAKITDLPPEIIRLIILDSITVQSRDLSNFLGAHDYLLAVAHMVSEEQEYSAYRGKLKGAIRLGTLFGWREERREVTKTLRRSKDPKRISDWVEYFEARREGRKT